MTTPGLDANAPMGLYDRDYVRSDRAGARGAGPRGLRGVGDSGRINLGYLTPRSFNTWLIIINVLVFLVANVALAGRSWQRPLETGSAVWIDGTTPAQREGAQADRSKVVPVPVFNVPGYELRDPRTRRILGYQFVQYRPLLEVWGHFSTAKAFFGLEVWRFVTFQFLHSNFMHLAFNLLGLWMVGGIVEEYLGRKRYAAFYLVCGIFGALMYLVLNLLGALVAPTRVPGLLFDDIHTPLVGASAGIFGVLMAAAYVAPRMPILVFYAIPMQLRTAVYGFTVVAFISLLAGTSNAGGEAAHVGGAIAGYFFIRRMHLLRDFFDVLGDSRSGGAGGSAGGSARRGPASPPKMPPGWRVVGNDPVLNAPRGLQSSVGGGEPDPAEVDRLLAKVAVMGVDALTPEEKQVLQQETERRRRG